MIKLPGYQFAGLEKFVRNGGCVVGLHQAACSDVNPWLADFFGVRAVSEFYATIDPKAVTFLRQADAPFTRGLPESFPVMMSDRFTAPKMAPGVKVIYTDGETGAPVVTVRAIGTRNGRAVWLAPGQEMILPAKRPGRAWDYDQIDFLGKRVDEQWVYPYLDSPHYRKLLIKVIKWCLKKGR
jgi:hypothetical protein